MIPYLALKLFATAFALFLVGALVASIFENEINVPMERFAAFLFWVAGLLVFASIMVLIWL